MLQGRDGGERLAEAVRYLGKCEFAVDTQREDFGLSRSEMVEQPSSSGGLDQSKSCFFDIDASGLFEVGRVGNDLASTRTRYAGNPPGACGR